MKLRVDLLYVVWYSESRCSDMSSLLLNLSIL